MIEFCLYFTPCLPGYLVILSVILSRLYDKLWLVKNYGQYDTRTDGACNTHAAINRKIRPEY